MCFVGLKGGFVRRFEKWGESVGGSIGYEVWGKGGAWDFVLRGVVLGGALCFGFRCGDSEVLCVLDCIWDFGVGFGRYFVYCGFGRVEILGGLRNGVKV